MQTASLWATKTFFPLFTRELAQRGCRSVAVVGASDGRFVLPLALAGYRVIAIERNATALHGGPVKLPGDVDTTMLGLHQRLALEGVKGRVEVIEGNLCELGDLPVCDAVWTSCSWHYSLNHHRPLRVFTDRMQALCVTEGLLGAEFMMPVEPRHESIEHYLAEGEVRRYFPNWPVVWETYTPPFPEAPHVEQLAPHTHRMGLLIAQRPNDQYRGITAAA